jgi:hypothetical protein
MEWTPNPPNSLILTHYVVSPDLPILPSLTLNQQLALLHYLFLLQISDADGFLSAVYVVGAQDGVFVGARGDVDADCRVGSGELGEEFRGEEGAKRGK